MKKVRGGGDKWEIELHQNKREGEAWRLEEKKAAKEMEEKWRNKIKTLLKKKKDHNNKKRENKKKGTRKIQKLKR